MNADGAPVASAATAPAGRDEMPMTATRIYPGYQPGHKLDSATAFAPATLAEGETAYRLPAAFDQVCVGASGRSLVFYFKALGKAAVFDVGEARITGSVPVGNDAIIAAGAEHLLIVDSAKREVRRYRLDTLKAEAARPLAVPGRPATVAMGSASQGPLLIGCGSPRCCTDWTSIRWSRSIRPSAAFPTRRRNCLATSRRCGRRPTAACSRFVIPAIPPKASSC